jgi:hypothetical protein
MLYLLFGPPVAFAFALGLLGASTTKRHWLYGIVAVACIHSLAVAGVEPSEHLLAQIGFAVLAPWFGVAALLALSSFPHHSVLIGFVVPVVFAVTFFGGLVLGVNIGLLRL